MCEKIVLMLSNSQYFSLCNNLVQMVSGSAMIARKKFAENGHGKTENDPIISRKI